GAVLRGGVAPSCIARARRVAGPRRRVTSLADSSWLRRAASGRRRLLRGDGHRQNRERGGVPVAEDEAEVLAWRFRLPGQKNVDGVGTGTRHRRGEALAFWTSEHRQP